MTRLSRLGFAVSALPLLASCSFLLDFNELQRGHKTAPDAGTGGSIGPDATAGSGGTGATGTGGAGGTPSSGGAGTGGGTAGSGGKSDGGGAIPDSGVGTDGGDASSCNCDDGDPCTNDRCTKAGACVHEPLGAIPDGLSDSVNSPTFYRTTMTVLDSHFYVSAFEAPTLGKYELLFHDFGMADKALGIGTTLAELMPGASAGLTATSAAGFEPVQTSGTIVAYIALGKAPASGQVNRFEFTPGLLGAGVRFQSSAPASADANYTGSVRLFPIAWNLGGGNDYAAWPGASGIYLQSGNNPLKAGALPSFAVGVGPVVALAPLGAGGSPGVGYITASGLAVQGIAQANGVPVGQCDTRPGTFLGLAIGSTGVDGLSLGAFTKTLTGNASGILTEETPLLCTSQNGMASCAGSSGCSKDAEVLASTRNPAITFFSRPNDPPDRVYEVQAIPYNDPTKGVAYLALQIVRLDLNLLAIDGGLKATLITPTPVVVATSPLSPSGSTGPQWPAVAFAGTDRVGLSWLEPGIATAGTTGTTHDELHVARYRICFPP